MASNIETKGFLLQESLDDHTSTEERSNKKRFVEYASDINEKEKSQKVVTATRFFLSMRTGANNFHGFHD